MDTPDEASQPELIQTDIGAGRYIFFVMACMLVLMGMVYYSLRIPPPPPPPELKADPVLARGYEIYMNQCLSCHGLQGRGDGPRSYSTPIKPRNLKEEAWKYGDDEEAVRRIITKGGPNGVMPAFEATIKGRDLEAITRYCRQLKLLK
ncbi:MAG: c-type cytochrome [bacterium]